jgi:hypothetical protein
MFKSKRKNISMDEVKRLTQDRITEANSTRLKRAERIANRINQRIVAGRFKVVGENKISVAVWGGFDDPPVWDELKQVLYERGFADIDYDISLVPFYWPIILRLK